MIYILFTFLNIFQFLIRLNQFPHLFTSLFIDSSLFNQIILITFFIFHSKFYTLHRLKTNPFLSNVSWITISFYNKKLWLQLRVFPVFTIFGIHNISLWEVKISLLIRESSVQILFFV